MGNSGLKIASLSFDSRIILNNNMAVLRAEGTILIDLTLRRLMSYIYGAPILDVSRSHTTTQHSR